MGITLNSRILLAAASILAVAALVVGATFAFFSDIETSNDNTFGAGTVDLVLCDSSEPCATEEGPEDSVTTSFSASNLVPGGSAQNAGYIEIRNQGSLPIAEVELNGVANTTIDNGDGSSLLSKLNITVKTGDDSTCTTNQNDITGTLATFFGDGFSPLTLAELGNGSTYDALPGVAPGNSYFICMDVALDSTTENDTQGDQAEIDLTFTANQDASQ